MRGKKTESLRCSTFHRASAHTVDSCLFLGAHLAGKNSRNQCRLEKTPGDVMKPHCSSWSVKKNSQTQNILCQIRTTWNGFVSNPNNLKWFCVKSEQLEMVLCQIRTTWYCFVSNPNNLILFCVGTQQLQNVLCWITTTWHCFVLDHNNLSLFCVGSQKLDTVLCWNRTTYTVFFAKRHLATKCCSICTNFFCWMTTGFCRNELLTCTLPPGVTKWFQANTMPLLTLPHPIFLTFWVVFCAGGNLQEKSSISTALRLHKAIGFMQKLMVAQVFKLSCLETSYSWIKVNWHEPPWICRKPSAFFKKNMLKMGCSLCNNGLLKLRHTVITGWLADLWPFDVQTYSNSCYMST